MQDTIIVVHTTVPELETAQALAKQLVEDELAACVQVQSPVTSYYKWEGKLEEKTEIPLNFKVAQHKEYAFRKRLLALHPYEVPQYLWIEAEAIIEYANWVND